MDRDIWVPETALDYARYLKSLRQARAQRQSNRTPGRSRIALSALERRRVLGKTAGRCHICGGPVADDWQADHILAHSAGGAHAADNYLPAHGICNNYRWDYLPEEFQEILRLGVWLRTKIQNQTEVGMQAASQYVRDDQNRVRRRKR
jgi:5-methylcytosine-specific restriction endonuclease McrA